MHIKQITISGFKSYRDATIAGPFSPGHNVVVGRNGSGKSNFFDAVRFVLSDTFSSLRAEERVALLHEGAGASVLSAYVEMLFDNSDGRLPSDRDVVALRRMVGLKKDEYVLDRKNVTRTEVFNLLESAGFSRSNPYYIVQQGKVAALCGMSDKQRLDLLKEVAGTRVYDERREESLKIMDETDQRREKITEVVSFIESRLSELESEKEELNAFQKLDKDRKALQYTIYILELDNAKHTLESIETQHSEHRSKSGQLNSKLTELRVNLSSNETHMKDLTPQIHHLQDEYNQTDTERKKIVEKIAKLQVKVSEASQAAEQTKEMISSTKSEMTDIRRQIEQKNQRLQPIELQFNQLKQNEDRITIRMKQVERDLLALRVKANRVNQFSSVQQRDTHLKRKIREERKRQSNFSSQITSAKREVERLQRAIDKNEDKLKTKKEELEALRQNTSGQFQDVDALRNKRDDMHLKRKELWRKTSEIQARIRELQGRVSKMEGRKRSVLGAGNYESIRSVMQFAHEDPVNLGPDRVFGPLVDLIDVDNKFATAADVTAGSTLTHVLVDSDSTAAKLVSLMQTRRAGRVTFIPLNRLDNNVTTPQVGSREAIPLVSKIRCDDRFRKAVMQVFGRTLVTRTVSVATDLSKQHGVDCVTLEGDQVNKRGAMTGGYVDLSRSRIMAAIVLKEARAELDKTLPQADELKREEELMHSQMSQVLGELQAREGAQRTANSSIARLSEETGQLERYLSSDKESLPKAQDRIKEAEQSVTETGRLIEGMEQEIGTPLRSGLTQEEEGQMQSSKEELDELKQQVGAIAPDRARLEKEVVTLRADLKNNLERRETQLKKRIAEAGVEGSDGEVDGEEVERRTQVEMEKQKGVLKRAENELNGIKVDLREKDKELNNKKKEYSRLSGKIDQDKEEESKIVKTLEDDRQLVENQYSLRAAQTQIKDEAEKNIRELGSLPADFDRFRGQSVGSLMKKLKKTNENLKKYAHVNKKALEQYMNFTEQRDTLVKRREELDSGAEAIRSLIDSLDHRKDEDIVRTFKGVSKYFCEVFSELVPGGRASLVMLKSSGRDGDRAGGKGRKGKGKGSAKKARGRKRQTDDNEDEENDDGGDGQQGNSGAGTGTPGRIEYTGVAMKVAFSSTGEAYLLQQLSGGQKSIVALALIFAIQRLDPAPFYLFDEIDANLDATHRQAVANVIRKQANHGTQFITTTFRPEFVNAGDMWYGVTHKKKVSSVQEVDREVALTFITDEPARRRR